MSPTLGNKSFLKTLKTSPVAINMAVRGDVIDSLQQDGLQVAGEEFDPEDTTLSWLLENVFQSLATNDPLQTAHISLTF